METSIEIGGLSIHSPVTTFTNVLLCIQCTLYYRAVRTGRQDRGGYWSLFFLAMAVTTLAGAPKHGLPHLMSAAAYQTVLWISNLGSAASVYFAQRATLVSRAGATWDSRLTRLSQLQLVLFLIANLVLGPEMSLVVANTAVGLLPVIVAEAMPMRRGERDGAWIAGGLGLSLLTGIVYVASLGLGRWLNHVDIAHFLMAASFALMVRGAPDRAAQQPVDPGRQSRASGFAVGLEAGQEQT